MVKSLFLDWSALCPGASLSTKSQQSNDLNIAKHRKMKRKKGDYQIRSHDYECSKKRRGQNWIWESMHMELVKKRGKEYNVKAKGEVCGFHGIWLK